MAKEAYSMWYNLGIYYRFISKYKQWFVWLFLLILVNESVNIAEKFLFKEIVDKGTAYTDGNIMTNTLISILLIVAIIYIGITAVKVIVKWLNIHILNRVEGRLIYDLKTFFFNHIIYLSHGFHTTHRTGSLIARLTRGGRAMERMTDTIIFNFAPLLFQLTVVGISLAYFSLIPAIIVCLTVVLFILYGFVYQIIQQKVNLIANDKEDIEKGNIGDIFTNIDSIKYFGKEEVIKKKYAMLATDTKDWSIKQWDYYRWLDSGNSLILGVGAFLLMWFTIKEFLNGRMSLGTVVFCYTVYGSLLTPLYSFLHGIREFYRVIADFDALFAYSKINNDIKDQKDAKELKIINGEINFKSITFKYGKRTIFKNFDLHVNQNEKVALVGHSGSGKSTLVKLLYRLYDVESGRITVDRTDIKEVKQESLREEMSVVPQECVLFDDTIYNNIAFSKPDAKREEVLSAMKFAQLDKIIKNFPNKEHTIVGERGVKLSGGEKQRVSIARAILANKKILVLDEATSSLDSETEHEIQKDLEMLMKGRTTIIIAHRLSTIMKADRVIVIKEGKIVQQGKHCELICKHGEYKKLWELQRGGYIE